MFFSKYFYLKADAYTVLQGIFIHTTIEIHIEHIEIPTVWEFSWKAGSIPYSVYSSKGLHI